MAVDFGAGCIGGAAGVIVGQPFDTVKVRLQIQSGNSSNAYRGIMHCVTTMIRQESVLSLYKGLTPPLVGLAFQNAIIFGLQGQFRKFVNDDARGETIAGAITGAAQAMITAPIELAKIKLQVQGTGKKVLRKDRKYKGPLQTLLVIHKGGGFRACFRGLVGVLSRDTPATAIYFGAFAYLNQLCVPEGGDVNSLGIGTLLLTGGIAGMLSWAPMYPIDVVKTRIQAEGIMPYGRYHSYLDCAKTSFKEEGYTWLTRGFNATMLRAFPVNAAILATVTLVLRYLNRMNDREDS